MRPHILPDAPGWLRFKPKIIEEVEVDELSPEKTRNTEDAPVDAAEPPQCSPQALPAFAALRSA